MLNPKPWILNSKPLVFSLLFNSGQPMFKVKFQLNFQPKSTNVYMWPFKGGDGWGFFNSSNLKFQLIFNSGQPMFKVKFSIEFSTEINPYLNVRV